MGIDSQWRKLLQKLYPECFETHLPDNVRIDTAIVDVTSQSYNIVHEAKSYRQMLERFNKNIVNNVEYYPLKHYIMLFDEFSPTNKASKPRSPVLSAEQIKSMGVSVGNGALPPDTGSLLSTYQLKKELYRYLAYGIENVHPQTPTAEPVPCSITLDGVPSFSGSGDIILKFKQYYQKFANMYDDSNISHIDSPKEIGESDLKVVWHLSNCQEGENVVVMNKDGDLIPIILMNMRDFIKEDTLNIPFNVWLHFSDSQRTIGGLYTETKRKKKQVRKKKSEQNAGAPIEPKFNEFIEGLDLDPMDAMDYTYDAQAEEKAKDDKMIEEDEEPEICLINMNELFRHICTDFKKKFNTDYGVFTFAMLIMMHYTDFVDGIPMIGFQRIWDAYCKGGFQILSGQEISHGVDKHKKIISTRQRVFMADLEVIGQPRKYHKVWLNEDRIAMFLRYLVHYVMDPKGSSVYAIPDCKELSEKLKVKQSKSKSASKTPGNNNRRLQVPSEKELISFARRVWWNCDYWINGGKIIQGRCNHHNPIEEDASSKLPKWGWFKKDGVVKPSGQVTNTI